MVSSNCLSFPENILFTVSCCNFYKFRYRDSSLDFGMSSLWAFRNLITIYNLSVCSFSLVKFFIHLLKSNKVVFCKNLVQDKYAKIALLIPRIHHKGMLNWHAFIKVIPINNRIVNLCSGWIMVVGILPIL